MPATKLINALKSINWEKNVNAFTKDKNATEKIAAANLRLAIWSKQLETIEKGNAALCFIREMQISGHLVATSTALGVYKSAAGAMRSMLETAMYYTYFRSHTYALSTLLQNPKWYISKTDVLEFHNLHTPNFGFLQAKFGLIAKLNPWYSNISAIVHGQVPGQWNNQSGLADIEHDKLLQDLVIQNFCEGEEIVHHLFLCTVGREIWDSVSSTAKKSLSSGISGDLKNHLGIDSA